MTIPITPRFSVSAEIQTAMAFLATDPKKAIFELRDTESAVHDRRREMGDHGVREARDKILEAAKTLQSHVLDQNLDDWETNWNVGLLLSRLDRDRDAMEFFGRAKDQNPDDQIIRRKIVHSLTKLHKHSPREGYIDRAIAEAKEALRIDSAPKTYESLGDAYCEAGRFEAAVESFSAASDRYESLDEKSNGYAERRASEILRRKLDRREDAIPFAEDAYDLDPAEYRNIEELGMAYAYAREHDRAIPLLQYAHMRKPQQRSVLLELHDCLMAKGEYRAAMEYADRLETHANRRVLALVKKLRVAEASHRHHHKGPEFARALEREFPHDFDANRALAGYYFAAESYERALPFLKRVMENPRGAAYTNRAAQAMRETGDVAGSENLVATLLQKDPTNPHYLLAAGWHAQDTGQLQMADHCAEQLRRNAPNFRAASAFLTVMGVDGGGSDHIEELNA